jgi:hypothetical protein
MREICVFELGTVLHRPAVMWQRAQANEIVKSIIWRVVEPDEAFLGNLSGAAGATIADPQCRDHRQRRFPAAAATAANGHADPDAGHLANYALIVFLALAGRNARRRMRRQRDRALP